MINVGSVVVKDVFDNVCIVANPERIVFQNGLIIKMDIKYDYLIVGSGLYGATFAYKAKQAGRKVLVIDKRPHLGGNVYCENVEGINVHKYGAHIFHTNSKEIWNFVNSIVEFNRYKLPCSQL